MSLGDWTKDYIDDGDDDNEDEDEDETDEDTTDDEDNGNKNEDSENASADPFAWIEKSRETGFRPWCLLPRQPPAVDHDWPCCCRPNQGPKVDNEAVQFFGRALKMGPHSMISAPVYAFPVSIDHLVAAALATRRALRFKKLVRPLLSRADSPAARRAAELFHDEGLIMNDKFHNEVLRQRTLVYEGKERRSDDDPDFWSMRDWMRKRVHESESDSDSKEEHKDSRDDPWTKGKRRGPYDIRTFREIHAMMHAAFGNSSKFWALVRDDNDVFKGHEEYYFHPRNCLKLPKEDIAVDAWLQKALSDASAPEFGPCCSLDPDYWNKVSKDWLEELNGDIEGDLRRFDRKPSEERSDNENDTSSDEDPLNRRFANKVLERRSLEMSNWKTKLVGANGDHRWLQENVIKVLEEAFDGVKITVINGEVLGWDYTLRNYAPMAWIHSTTQWEKISNPPYVEVAGLQNRFSYDDDRKHQGYAPLIPGDPCHWFSNAARDPKKSEMVEATAEELRPLQNIRKLFKLRPWLHPLQYISPEYDGSAEPSKAAPDDKESVSKGGESEKPNHPYNYEDGRLYKGHHVDRYYTKSKEKKWPAIVVLHKVLHQGGEGEEDHTDMHSFVDWDHNDQSDPNSDGDTDYKENKEFIEEVRQHLDKISSEVTTYVDKVDSYTWPADEREGIEHQQNSDILKGTIQALEEDISRLREIEASREDNVTADHLDELLSGLQQFLTDYEAKRKNLQEGTEHVTENRPLLDEVLKQTILKAKFALVDLDKLRRKRYRDFKNERRKKENIRAGRDDLEGLRQTLAAESTEVGDKKKRLEKDKKRLERELSKEKRLNRSGQRDYFAQTVALVDENQKLKREKDETKRKLGSLRSLRKLHNKTHKAQVDEIKDRNEKRKQRLKQKRQSKKGSKSKDGRPNPSAGNGGDDDDDDDDDDEGDEDDDDQPPKKKQKTGGAVDDGKTSEDKGEFDRKDDKNDKDDEDSDDQPPKKRQKTDGAVSDGGISKGKCKSKEQDDRGDKGDKHGTSDVLPQKKPDVRPGNVDGPFMKNIWTLKQTPARQSDEKPPVKRPAEKPTHATITTNADTDVQKHQNKTPSVKDNNKSPKKGGRTATIAGTSAVDSITTSAPGPSQKQKKKDSDKKAGGKLDAKVGAKLDTTSTDTKPATKSATKAPTKPTTETGNESTTTKKAPAKTETKAVDSKTTATTTTTTTTTTKASAPRKSIFKELPTETVTTSAPPPPPSPPPPRAKPKAKPKPPTQPTRRSARLTPDPAPSATPAPVPKAESKPKAKPTVKAKPRSKTQAKPAASASVPAAASAPAPTPTATAAPSNTTNAQPTRRSRRQNKEEVEVGKVSDPEKEAKKEKRKRGD